MLVETDPPPDVPSRRAAKDDIYFFLVLPFGFGRPSLAFWQNSFAYMGGTDDDKKN
jgi:hypothetical protein